MFLGPGGAQYNAPQMYWKDIGTTTDAVFAHTYAYNLIYRRADLPARAGLQQPAGAPDLPLPPAVARLRGPGVSWWDWQEATHAQWLALSRPAGAMPGYASPTG